MEMSEIRSAKTAKGRLGPAAIPVFLVAVIIAIAPWATYTQIALLATPVSISIGVLLISSIIYFLFNNNDRNIYKEDILLGIFVAIICFSYFESLHRDAWALVAFWYISCILTYISTKSIFTKKEYLGISSYAAIAGIFVTLALIGPTVNEYGILSDRQAVPDHNNNFTAYCLCALVFIILSNLLLNKISIIYKAVSHISIAIAIYSIILLGTRGALISIMLLYIFLFLRKFVGKTTYRTFSIIFIIVSALTAVGLLETFLTRIDTLSTRGDGELSGRSPSWEVARAYFLDHPFLGIGAGAFQFVNPLQIGVHNTTLALAMDAGILGVAILFAWVAINFANIKLKDPRKSQMAVLWMAYALPISLSGEWILSPLVWITFGMLFGLKDPANPVRTRL